MDTDAVIEATQVLSAVQESMRAAIADTPWPSALIDIVIDVLSERTRVLGGRLTPWAILPLCCCMAIGKDWRPALPAAVAAEVYSTALDLFDDVEDGDSSEPVNRHGIPIVLNVATALLALAHIALQPETVQESAGKIAAHRRAQDALWTGLAVATGGQHVDLATAGAPPLSVEECLDIACRKGGALTAACCRAGASFGTDDADLIERFGLFGTSLGLWGQLDNDMHDAGNSLTKSDLAQRKQTVPIAVARATADAAALGDAVWHGGIHLAYALVHTELARTCEALETIADACPDPAFARTTLGLLLQPGSVAAGDAA
jgi:geranylgeranyl pyrophosphate synthase